MLTLQHAKKSKVLKYLGKRILFGEEFQQTVTSSDLGYFIILNIEII